jgi:POT family proton-dependent oligopeptide transporter
VSTLVGSLYQPGDTRRDAGFSIFYMGINLGAVIGPLIAGYLAERVDWHLGFASAGIGMALGLTQYIIGRSRLQPAIARIESRPKVVSTQAAGSALQAGSGMAGFTSAEWKGIGAIVIFFIAASLFWGAYEQAGSTLNLFADRYTRLEVFGFSFPASWFQSVPPIFVILLAPAFAWLWLRLGPREPSVPTKFAFGLFFMALSFLVLVPAGGLAQAGEGVRISPWWLVASYFISELGESVSAPSA